MNARTRRPVWLVILVIVAAAAVGGFIGAFAFPQSRNVPFWIASGAADAPAREVSFQNGFAPVVEPDLPAVVNVSSSRVVKAPSNPEVPPFFQQFFGGGTPRPQREQSLGSGVIVNPDGYILTGAHVVEKGTDIRVSLWNKQEYKAKVVGADMKTDVAVLKIEQKGLPTMVMGDSSKVRVGDFALAIGNPFGIGETVTMGIISAKGRSGLDVESYEDFLQTDAAINPGNSGGALVNVRGELIGLNAAIITGGGGNEGIGFAIPINLARNVMDQLIKTGKVVRGWLGVGIQEVTPAMARAFGLKETGGVVITEVTPGGPADQAGIKTGDVIIAANSKPITNLNDFRLSIANTAPGSQVRLRISRNGQQQEVTATLGEMPATTPQAGSAQAPTGGPLAGVTVTNLTADIAGQLNLPPATKGVVVTKIDPMSPAADAGLQMGDVIDQVDRKPVTNVTDYQAALKAAQQNVLLRVNRGGSYFYVAIETR